MSFFRGVVVLVLSVTVAGCAHRGSATQPAVAVDPATTQPSYWLSLPGSAQVVGGDFDGLWRACEDVVRRYHYPVDRTDYRHGLLSSEPVVSRQFFEVWRRDGTSAASVAESSLAKIRRTIVFEITREGEAYLATPKVLVERFASVEPKLRGTMEQASYWYPVGRDYELELKLADAVRKELARKSGR